MGKRLEARTAPDQMKGDENATESLLSCSGKHLQTFITYVISILQHPAHNLHLLQNDQCLCKLLEMSLQEEKKKEDKYCESISSVQLQPYYFVK